MKELLDVLRQPNVVVIDSLAKARIMNKLLLLKITVLTVVTAFLLRLPGWDYWMIGAGIAFITAYTYRGFCRDVSNQNILFPERTKSP